MDARKGTVGSVRDWVASKSHQNLVVGGIIGAGVLFRLVAYLHNQSFWLDEAMLAYAILQRSFMELLEPLLEFNQAAPAGFLYLVRSTYLLFGPKEPALRVVPLLAGLTSLPLFYLLARRYVDRLSAVLALALFAVSERLVYHSIEMKQYSTDVLVVLLTLLAIEPILRGAEKRRHWLILGAAGAAAVWFSHPVIFVLAPAGLVLFGLIFFNGNRKRLMNISVVGVVWLSSFGINYLLITRHVAADPHKLKAFADSFMPITSAPEIAEWFRDQITNLTEKVLRFPTTLGCAFIGLICLMIGVGRMFARNKARAMILIGPLVFCLVAATLHTYPFKPRLVVFLSPMLLICIGLGAQWLATLDRRRWLRIVGTLAVVILLIMPTARAVHDALTLTTLYGREEMRPVFKYVLEREQPEDTVYFYRGADAVFLYYRKAYGYEPQHWVTGGRDMPESQARYRARIEQLFKEEGPRIWFVFRCDGAFERERMLSTLDRVATRVDRFEVNGAAAFLYRATPAGGGDGAGR